MYLVLCVCPEKETTFTEYNICDFMDKEINYGALEVSVKRLRMSSVLPVKEKRIGYIPWVNTWLWG